MSELSFLSFCTAALARNSATPPPATMPSSTAARVALSASSTRSFFSLTSTSVEPPTRITATPPASLGRVDGFDDDEAQSECDEGSEVLVRFLAAERNAFKALALADEGFDAGAGAIERLREERRPVLGR